MTDPGDESDDAFWACAPVTSETGLILRPLPLRLVEPRAAGRRGKAGSAPAQQGLFGGSREAASGAPTRILSVYQDAALGFLERGEGDGAIIARAGSGKSFLLTEGARRIVAVRPGARVLACAYNSDIKKYLEGVMPAGVAVETLHSLGFKALLATWDTRPAPHRRRLRELVDAVAPSFLSREQRAIVGKAIGMAKAFLAVGAAEILPVIAQFKLWLPWESINAEQKVRLSDRDLARWVERALTLSRAESDAITFDEMFYVAAAEGWPVGSFDYVLGDEMQDWTVAMARLASLALAPGGRLIGVGDDWQCHPPGVMIRVPGGERAVEGLATGDLVVPWDRGSQKAVGSRPATVAVRHFEGQLCDVAVEGHDASVPMTPNHKVLARWVDRASRVCVTYLMYRRGYGYRVGWCQLFTHSGTVHAMHLSQRARLEKADAVWILRAHEGRTDASAYESIVAAKYGLPTVTFEPVHGAKHLGEDTLRRIFDALAAENDGRGEHALRDHGREPGLPFYPFPRHADDVASVGHRGTLFAVYAANALPGLMALPLGDGVNAWRAIRAVDRRPYEGPVYSLDVPVKHNYVANGVVVLNSIYGWNGADEQSIPRFIARRGASTFSLPITYRCARAIVAYIRPIVDDFEAAPGAPEGMVEQLPDDDTWMERVGPDSLVVSRSNAALVAACLGLLRRGVSAYILGKDTAKHLKDLITAGEKALAGAREEEVEKGAKAPPAPIVDWQRWLLAYAREEGIRLGAADEEAEADSLRERVETLLALCEGMRTTRALRDRITALFDPHGPQPVRCATTHRAKGLEGRVVVVLSPTYRPGRGGEELRLWYVALSRARDRLLLVGEPDWTDW